MLKYYVMNKELLPFADQLKLFFTSPIFWAPISGWIIAQVLKGIICIITGKYENKRELAYIVLSSTGGMPSSHSAMTAALCTSIGFKTGINSEMFIFAFFYFFITAKDAFGVRRSSGLQAQKINEIGEELEEKNQLDFFQKIKVVKGHKPIEVVFGGLLGIALGVFFSMVL